MSREETPEKHSPPAIPADGTLPDRLGIIAGGGRFPFLVAEGARRRGLQVFGAGIRYQVLPEFEASCDRFRVFSLGRLGAAMRFFRRHGVRELAWAGWIRKELLFGPWRWLHLFPDWRMVKIYFFRVRNRQDHTLLGALAEEFESEGIHVVHSAKYCPEILAEEGVLSRRRPSKRQMDDIRFGWSIAKRIADLQIGQSVVVSEKATIAVEGMEGTDRNIRRAGELYRRGGFTVVKVAKETHDMRFDVPTVGPDTIRTLHEAGGAVLAIEAGRTLVLEREEFLREADRHGIVVVAYRTPPEA
jgi:hypothetical protein